MKTAREQLRKELSQVGANDEEIHELIPIAANLHLLKEPDLPAFRPTPWWQRLAKPVLFTAPGFVVGATIIVLSQAVLPTSWLYPVQQFSDSVATSVQPGYKAQIMMKRAQQVNQLVARKADSKVILTTLASYSADAKSYKKQSHTSYAAFEYCKTSLQQAAANSSPSVRSAINASLQALDT